MDNLLEQAEADFKAEHDKTVVVYEMKHKPEVKIKRMNLTERKRYAKALLSPDTDEAALAQAKVLCERVTLAGTGKKAFGEPDLKTIDRVMKSIDPRIIDRLANIAAGPHILPELAEKN